MFPPNFSFVMTSLLNIQPARGKACCISQTHNHATCGSYWYLLWFYIPYVEAFPIANTFHQSIQEDICSIGYTYMYDFVNWKDFFATKAS